MMWKIAECYEADGRPEDAVSETERALGLISCLHEENSQFSKLC